MLCYVIQHVMLCYITCYVILSYVYVMLYNMLSYDL